MMTYSITHQPFDIFISYAEKRLWSLWSVCYMYINDDQSLDGWCYTLQIHVCLKWSVLGWVTLHVTDTSEMMLMISPWMGDAIRYRYVWDDVDDQSLDGWRYTLQICLRWCGWYGEWWLYLWTKFSTFTEITSPNHFKSKCWLHFPLEIIKVWSIKIY